MKPRIIVSVLIAILSITATGYTEQSDNKNKLEEIKGQTKALMENLKAYTTEQKQEAIQDTKATLGKLDAHIDELESRVDTNWDEMDKAARQKARGNLKALRKKRNQVAEKYGSLKTSSGNAWEHMKDGFSEAYESLVDAWEKSEKEFGAGK